MHDKAFNIAKNPNFDGYQKGIASAAYKSFDKNFSGGAVTGTRSETLATRHKSAIEVEVWQTKS